MRESFTEFARRNVALLVVSSTDLELTSFIAETLRAPYPVLSDPAWQVFSRYGVGSGFGVPLPATLLIDAAGIIRWSWYAPFSPIFQPPTPQALLALLDRPEEP